MITYESKIFLVLFLVLIPFLAFSKKQIDDFDFSYLKFPNEINAPKLSVSNVKYTGAKFDSIVIFSEDTLYGAAMFDYTTFFDSVSFRQSHIDWCYFEWAYFHKYANFEQVTFFNDALFYRTNFCLDADFVGTHFKGNGDFEMAIFKGWADFSSASFENAYFDGVEFDSTVVFNRSKFKNKMEFSGLQNDANTEFIFDSCSLPDTIDFSINHRITNEINLTTANFHDSGYFDFAHKKYFNNRRHYINLSGSDISKFRLDYYHFKLLIKEPQNTDEVKVLYEGLLKNFEAHGQMDSRELLDIEYHDYILGNLKFLRWWNLYGYKKQWIFLWMGGLLFLFTFFTFLSIHFLNKDTENNGVYPINSIPTDLQITSVKSFFKRLWYSLIYTSIIFFLFSIKIEKMNFKRGAILYVIFLYSVGLLCLGYFANFVLQK